MRQETSAPDLKSAVASGIILSEAGRAVLELVSRPTMARRPVTCNQAFLDDYAPNTTFYLPDPLRAQLDMGRTGDSARPAGTHLRDVIGRLMIDLSRASSKLEGNREQIRAMVRDVVVEGHADIGEYLPDDTDPDTRARLQAIVDAELADLQEGNGLRFGIRRSQFKAWVGGERLDAMAKKQSLAPAAIGATISTTADSLDGAP